MLALTQAASRLLAQPHRARTQRAHTRASCPPLRRCVRASSGVHDVGVALVLSEERRRFSREVSRDGAAPVPAPDDYYTLLRIAPGASAADVKAAYRALQKSVHPDLAGASAARLSMLLNLAFETLSDETSRAAYDHALRAWRAVTGRFDGRPVSAWAGTDADTDAVFVRFARSSAALSCADVTLARSQVDECRCIGCGKCASVAASTFAMEDEWGRARVATQWADSRDLIGEAVATCPVECIAYVKRSELALLEHVMKSCHRENIAIMSRRRGGNFGVGPPGDDPFQSAAQFIAARQRDGLPDARADRQLTQNDELAAAISGAWLALDADLRAETWPEWSDGGGVHEAAGTPSSAFMGR